MSPEDEREGALEVSVDLSKRMRLLKAYKVYNGEHQDRENFRLQEMGIGSGAFEDVEVGSKRMFFGGSVQAIHSALRHGFANSMGSTSRSDFQSAAAALGSGKTTAGTQIPPPTTTSNDSTNQMESRNEKSETLVRRGEIQSATAEPAAIMLHSDPYTAAAFSLSATDEVDELFAEDELRRAEPTKESNGGITFNVLMCRVTVPQACTQRLEGARPVPAAWTDQGYHDEAKEEESKISGNSSSEPRQPFKFSGLCTSSLCRDVLSNIPISCHAARVAHRSMEYPKGDTTFESGSVAPHTGSAEEYDEVVIESATGCTQSASQRHSSLLVPRRNAPLVVPECLLLCQLLPEGADTRADETRESSKKSPKRSSKTVSSSFQSHFTPPTSDCDNPSCSFSFGLLTNDQPYVKPPNTQPLAEQSLESVLEGLTIPAIIGDESQLGDEGSEQGNSDSSADTLLSRALAITDPSVGSSLSRSASVASHAARNLNTSTAGAVLNKEFKKRLLTELLQYQRRVWQEISPSTASKLDGVQEESRKLRKTLETLRKQIDGEKTLQEQILRDFRNQFNKSVGRGDGYPSSSSS